MEDVNKIISRLFEYGWAALGVVGFLVLVIIIVSIMDQHPRSKRNHSGREDSNDR